MTVADLKRLIEIGAIREDATLVVAVSEGGFPSTPSIPVHSFCMGFDWDSGKCIIRTQSPVVRKPTRKKRKQGEASNG